MIRATTLADTPVLVKLAEGTGVFKPMELAVLRVVLDDYHGGNADAGHRSVTWEQDGQALGFAYYAPAAMTDRTWYLYWIAVAKTLQGRGSGAKLLGYAEDDIRRAGGRLLLIETSSLPHYEPTRRFYHKLGYERAAVLADYNADGDDMIVFRKRMT